MHVIFHIVLCITLQMVKEVTNLVHWQVHFGAMTAHIKPIIFTLKLHNVGTIMTLFGLFGIWVLVFWNIQSQILSEDGLLSNVDVKNLLQRMIRLEEYLKERKDSLQKTVNVLATNFEQTKRVFDEKCKGHGKDCKNIRIKLMRLSDTSERIAMNP